MNSCELVSLVTALSCAIARCVPKEDLPLLTTILGQLSSTLATITVNEESQASNESPMNTKPGSEVIAEQPPMLPL